MLLSLFVKIIYVNFDAEDIQAKAAVCGDIMIKYYIIS